MSTLIAKLRKLLGNGRHASTVIQFLMNGKSDLIIRNGRIVDGSGASAYDGVVCVKDGRIVDSGNQEASVVLDATGCIVAPGFIDAHSNLSWGLFIDPACKILSFQGVTTAITGNCGGSAFPVVGEGSSWIRKAASDYGLDVCWDGLQNYAEVIGSISIDIMPLVGHGTLRAAVAGFKSESLNTHGIGRLSNLLKQSLNDGAHGVSFGLAYAPGMFATARELEACCKEVAAVGRICCFHIRVESDRLIEAVEEIVGLAQRSGARCVVCHHKALGRSNWGKVEETIAIVDEANKNGCDIFFDVYPYTTALRNLATMLPDWAHQGGREFLVRRLKEKASVSKLAAGLRENVRQWDASWNDTIIWTAPSTPELEGSRASDIIEKTGEEGLLEVILRNQGRVLTLYEGASFLDLSRVAQHPRAIVGSDGNAQHQKDPGHPRSFATFPKFLADFVLRDEVLSLESAIHKMTGLSAKVFGLWDRGLIRDGLIADLCVFSIDSLQRSTSAQEVLLYPMPKFLIKNGKVIINDGEVRDDRSGRVLFADR